MSDATFWTLILGSLGLLIMWTTTAIGFAVWLETKFNSLLSVDDYYLKHKDLEERIRNIEIHIASKCGIK